MRVLLGGSGETVSTVVTRWQRQQLDVSNSGGTNFITQIDEVAFKHSVNDGNETTAPVEPAQTWRVIATRWRRQDNIDFSSDGGSVSLT